MLRLPATRLLFLLAGSLVPSFSQVQGLLWLDQMSATDNERGGHATHAPPPQGSGEAPSTGARITIPAGTRVLMTLQSPLHTTSGTQGSGIYLETLYPVIQDNQIVIPAHSQVQGNVEINHRPGHLQRVSEFKFRFTSLIFPNSHVVAIDAVLQSIPGSATTRAQRGDRTLQTVDQAEKVVIPAATGAATGTLLGSVSRTGVGTFVGGGLGAGLGLVGILLHRGDEISLPRGTNIEMVLQNPLVLEPAQAAFNAQYVPPVAPNVDAKEARDDSDEHMKESRRVHPRRPLSSLPSLLP